MSSRRVAWNEAAWLEEARQALGDTGGGLSETVRDMEDTDALLRGQDDDDEECLIKDYNANKGSINRPTASSTKRPQGMYTQRIAYSAFVLERNI